MADNGTAASAPTIAWDDIGGVAYQRIKQAWGVDGTATDTSDTNPLPVSARRDLLAIRVNSAGLTTASTAYSAGDQVGTIFTLPNAARASGGTGTIVGVTLTDAADIIGAYDVVFANSSITLAADNATFAISDAHSLNVIGITQLAGAYDIGNNRVAQAFNLAIPYDCSGSTNLYASLLARIGHTFFTAVTDLQLTVWVERN